MLGERLIGRTLGLRSAFLAGVVIVSLAGCTTAATPARPSVALPSSTVSTSTVTASTVTTSTSAPAAAPPARLKPPAAVPGELSRLVVSLHGDRLDRVTTVRRDARAGHEYRIRAACTASVPGTTLSYEVRNGKPGAEHEAAVVSGDVSCDGEVTEDGLGALPAEPLVVYLRGDQTDVTSAYAVITPSVAK